jgi:hypothetical protein
MFASGLRFVPRGTFNVLVRWQGVGAITSGTSVD